MFYAVTDASDALDSVLTLPITKLYMSYEIRLLDVSGGTPWMATSATGGNALANFDKLVSSLVTETVEELVHARLIPPKKRQP